MSKAKKILCALCLPFPYTTFAKSGSVNYSWGADALATMHDFVVTMMLYVFIQQHILMFAVLCFGMYRKIGDFGIAEYNAFDGVRHQGVFHVLIGITG